jgi:hypothetical protein
MCLGEHDGSGAAQPGHDRCVLLGPSIDLAGVAGTRKALDVDPVLDRHGQSMQRAGHAACGKRLIQAVRVGQRPFVTERRDRPGLLVYRVQRREAGAHDVGN